jgi:NADH-quinone oxidoreductase subunit F
MPFEPVLLANVGKPESYTLPVYESTGGYTGLRKVLKEMTPVQTIDLVKSSNLRGRGGAGFPTGLKWSFLPKDHPGPIYMCINADESEPGTFNNRILMEDDPHQIIEGIIIGCYATKATTAYLYIRVEYPLSYKRLQMALDECYAKGYLGKNILGSEFSLDI